METRSKMDFDKQKNPALTELPKRIKNFSKLIIPKGTVLLKQVEVKRKSDIILPDGVESPQDYTYYKVQTTGYHVQEEYNKEVKADEFTITKPGNIVIFLAPRIFPMFIYKDETYLLASEGDIKMQIPETHFKEI